MIEEWPAEVQREEVFHRFLEDKEDLLQAGKELGIDWFDRKDRLTYKEEEEARERLVEATSDLDQFKKAMKTIRVDESSENTLGSSMYLGADYTVWISDDGVLRVKLEADEEKQEKIKKEVKKLVDDNRQKYAFLRGIILGGEKRRDRLSADWSQVTSYGADYHDGDGMFNPTHLKSFPDRIPGVSFLSTGSGTRYKVNSDIAPVIWQALEEIEEDWKSPVRTPGAEVPKELDKRIPKFQEVMDDVEVTEEDIEEFKEILLDNDALDYWKDYVAPKVKYRDRAKEVLLCVLASPEDEHGNKGRTNAIFYGPPGTGKTVFKNFLSGKFGAYSIDGSRVSKADLTYNKNTGDDGLLVRAHKGLAAVEEADKMDDNAMGAALTALGESGELEIRDKRLPAEVRGLMLGNYDSREEIIEKHGEALFNRFEFVLKFDKLDEEELNETLDWHYKVFKKPKPKEDASRLKRYLRWVRDFDPEIPEEELEKISEFKEEKLDQVKNVREGISMIRVAYTIARLNHRDVTLQDYKKAFKLVGGD